MENTDIITLYHGQQLSFCEEDVKDFVRTVDCYRVAAYKPFDRKILPLLPSHACCANCSKSCACEYGECPFEIPPFEKEITNMTSANQTMNRPVSPSDKEDLIMALKELANMFHPIVKQICVPQMIMKIIWFMKLLIRHIAYSL
jgi:hypothetical protein